MVKPIMPERESHSHVRGVASTGRRDPLYIRQNRLRNVNARNSLIQFTAREPARLLAVSKIRVPNVQHMAVNKAASSPIWDSIVCSPL